MVFKNCLIALPDSDDFVNADIREENGIIVEIGKNLNGKEGIDLKNLLVFPGGIDAHTHFNEPGFEEREEFLTGSMGGISSGITMVIDMPCTSIPPVTNIQNLLTKLKKIEGKSYVDYGLFGGVSGNSFDEFEENMRGLKDYVSGFKTYFLSGMETFNELDHFQFENVLRIAKEIKKPVLLHAEDPLYVRSATEKFKKLGDKPLYYYFSRPEIAEIISVQNACRINEKIGAELHFVHISSSESVDIISKYDNVTCETGPHYLEFSSEELERFGPILKTAPVVKSSENRERLMEKFIKGEIFYIASDHAPAPSSEKIGKNIWEAYSGIPGIETLYIYTLSEFLFKKKIGLKDFLKLTSENPAKRFNIFKRKGSIEIGKDCDLVVVNPDGETVVKGERFFSKGKLTPFEGMRFKGVIEMTILRGNIAFKNPDYFSKPSGIFIKPEVKNG